MFTESITKINLVKQYSQQITPTRSPNPTRLGLVWFGASQVRFEFLRCQTIGLTKSCTLAMQFCYLFRFSPMKIVKTPPSLTIYNVY